MLIIHDAFLVLSALSLGAALHHGLAWVRRRDLRANLLFAGVSILISVYAFSMRLKVDCSDLASWVRHDRFELSLILLLIPLFVETVAVATRAPAARWRWFLLAPLAPLLVWHWISPYGFMADDVRGMESIRQSWGEAIWWIDGTTSFLYQCLLVYVTGWVAWFLARSWHWARHGSPFSGWSLFGALAFLLGCVVVEFVIQYANGAFPFPLIESSFIGVLGAMSLLLSDEVMRIAVLQQELEASRAQLSKLNVDLERRVDERTRELQGALSELEMFSYSVSHDLRTPLRAIDGFSLAVMEEHALAIGAEGRHNLERVRAAAQKLGELFDDLVGLIRSRGISARPVDFDLSAMMREVAGEMCERNPDHDVRIEIPSSLTALSDPGLMRTVVIQLFSNAWKFTRGVESPRIEVVRDGVWVAIRDNGIGFEPAHGHKLFRPFQRLHLDERYPGNGVGLAIVHRIMTRLGGEVSALGVAGAGAEFRLRIPGLGRQRS